MEMVVTLAIIAIVAVISGTIFPVIDGMRFRNEAGKLSGALSLARNLAMTNGKCISVQVNEATRKLSIHAHPMPTTMKCQLPLSPTDAISTVAFEDFVDLGNFDDRNPLVFGPRGSTSRSDIAKITIAHKESASRTTFTVMPASGKVSGQ